MKKYAVTLLLTMLLGGCSLAYCPDIQQGNVIDHKEAARLKVGMTTQEVKNHLGCPILENAFDKNELEYVYTFQPNGGRTQMEKLVLKFKENKLKSISRN